MCATIAPVDVLIVSGNNDEERSFYLGEVLSALYSNTDRIFVDNSAKKRKYYSYGNVLLGLTHGYHEKLKELKDLMAYEVRDKCIGSSGCIIQAHLCKLRCGCGNHSIFLA